jgi:hypothetical protein
MSLSSAHYPETLSTIAVVNAPSFFPTVWSAVSRFFDEGTRRKVHVLGAEPGSTLLELIESKDLPQIYGGELKWKYEDEPIYDDEIEAIVGHSLPPGPLVWEEDKIKPVGSGRASTNGLTNDQTSKVGKN